MKRYSNLVLLGQSWPLLSQMRLLEHFFEVHSQTVTVRKTQFMAKTNKAYSLSVSHSLIQTRAHTHTHNQGQ